MTADLEQRLSRAMRSVAIEKVPDARPVPPPPAQWAAGAEPPPHPVSRRSAVRRWALPVGVAALAAMAVSIPFAISRSHQSGPAHQIAAMTAGSCPGSYAGKPPWVPVEPSNSGSRSSLVPPAAPASAVVCAYGLGLPGSHSTVPLSGGRVLTGGLDRLARDLHALPAAPPRNQWACTTESSTNVNYLIGLQYSGAVVWVSSSQSPCRGTSNGSFVSATEISSRVAAAYASGSWR